MSRREEGGLKKVDPLALDPPYDFWKGVRGSGNRNKVFPSHFSSWSVYKTKMTGFPNLNAKRVLVGVRGLASGLNHIPAVQARGEI